MRIKKYISVFCAGALLFTLSGCAGTQEEAVPSPSQPSAASEETAAQALYGQVTKVDGTKITVLLGAYSQPSRPENGQEPPEGFDGGGENAPGGRKHAETDGSQKPSKKSEATDSTENSRPSGGPGNFGGFQAGTETAIYDLSSAEIVIEKGHAQTAGTMEDIPVDAIVELTVEKDTVTSVVVRSAMRERGPEESNG